MSTVRPDEADDVVLMSPRALQHRCRRALQVVGASPAQATVLARATVHAEIHGRSAVGLAHLSDYVNGFRTGRIKADAAPIVERLSPVLFSVDCAGGIAQQGFEAALPLLAAAAKHYGIAVATVSRSFTVGELGFYVRQLVDRGLLGLAAANSPALMSAMGSNGPLFGTNPMAFGVPLPDEEVLLVDQASSAAAWVTVRAAAAAGQSLAPGTAVDSNGDPTDSATAALGGALLPFGGYKGGNVALVVEVLAALAGGGFSCEAPPFDRGESSPGVGLFAIAISPEKLRPGFGHMLAGQLRHWEHQHGAEVSTWKRQRWKPDHLAVPTCLLPDLS